MAKNPNPGPSGAPALPKVLKDDDQAYLTHGQSVMETIPQDDDERVLAQIGYRQELHREFNLWSTVSYAVSILGVLGSVPGTFNIPIASGGPGAAVWCWFFGSLMSMCIACSVAELVSAYPTAGGMYFVTKFVVPERKVAVWAWVIGWCNFLGQTAGVASVAFSVAQMILATVTMNSHWDGEKYSYVPNAAQTVVTTIGLLVVMGVVCSFTTRSLHNMILWFAPINITASIGICIALLAMTPEKQPASWVFGHVTDGSGWGSKGFSFLLGFLAVAWTMTDYDGTSHMSEETHHAQTRAPIAITSAVAISGIVGWMITITLCFCIQDLDRVLESPTGMVAAQIFLDAGGRTGGTAMWFWVILIQFFTGLSAMLADTRMAYAFSRDGAFPFSDFFRKINHFTHTPVNSVWLVVGCCIILVLIALGSTATILSIFAITAPCLDISYIAVILARNIYRKEVEFVYGPFTLGRLGKPLNYIAITWVVFISVVLFFPPVRPITGNNMNYAVAVTLFIGAFSMVWWWAGAKKKYTGPRTKLLLSQPLPNETDV